MRLSATIIAGAFSICAGAACAAETTPRDLVPIILPPAAQPGAAVQPYVSTSAPVVALTHVRVIDGTGAPARDNQTVVIEAGKIAAIGADAAIPANAKVIDLFGHTVFPGLVGMHDHFFYIARPNLTAEMKWDRPLIVPEMTFSAPRLYLANGVTTLRTTGSVEPYTDLNLKHAIDAGKLPGPHMDVTGPYLEGADSPFIQMHPLRDADDAKETVNYWAKQGVTSFKAYMNITRAELKAAVDEAHVLGLKITGHLCAVTYREAAALGIDDLEHGFFVNTENDPGKAEDACTKSDGEDTLYGMDPNGAAAKALIADLVAHHVAITSTLPVFEQDVPDHAPLWPRAMASYSPEAARDYLFARKHTEADTPAAAEKARVTFQHGMALERAFVAAGGLLFAGPDPTGNGGVVAGFGDLREVELLVEEGFTPEQAIHIASYNGAFYLGLESRIGSLGVGKDADIVVVKGDPSNHINDIENVETVFKDGVGYDTQKLLDSVKGHYGQY
ncbi:MAG TPA: amidohydrolase family protein [Rhizomicrobium sp.]|jgi:imidazolonepropionase-like amidohydrolase|nr:amidohydrolase family protein [Rhizomicrobium sp.]